VLDPHIGSSIIQSDHTDRSPIVNKSYINPRTGSENMYRSVGSTP
jgi:hypothetical protein